VAFTVTEKGPQYLCCCKHTRTAPYCDGSHEKL
jgi:CDGSH-type Zn-finger protein